MKKLFFNLFTGTILISLLTLTSCKSNDKNDPIDVLIEQGVLYGTLEHEATLDASKVYSLTGTLVIADGGVLTIPAGTKIKAQEGFGSYILVAQGGKINVNGTAANPVIMTAADETNAASGYWGGLVINGRAKISGTTGVTATSSCEMNTEYIYGGTNDADNSGNITYLMIKYAGARSSAEVEHNGLTLDAVGNGTTIENIYILESADDGIEFFGGTVNVKNLLVVNSDDDMFDNTQGYRGALTNCYGIWEKGFTSSESDPRGVESDGNLDGKTPEDANQTDFSITNMTIDIKLDPATTADKILQDVVKIRRGAKANIVNALIKGTGTVQDLADCTDSKGDAATGTIIDLTNLLISPITGSEKKVGTNNAAITISTSNTGCNTSIFSWTGYTGF
ncbi:MAG: hypothetical protein ACK5L7_06690 [Paludibacteraceae bacterium]